MPPRAWNESGLGGIFTTVRFAIVATVVLVGSLAMPVFSQTASAGGATSVPAWKLELRAAPNPGAASDQGGQDSGPVSPNVRVNARQAPAPAGLLGRSETTIAVAPDGHHMVAGWNDAQGFCGPPFGAPCAPQVPNGLSGYGFSANGGSRWTDGGAPDPSLGFGSVGVPVFTRGDPWLAIGADGQTFFYANLAVNRDTGADLGVSVHRGSFNGPNFAWHDVRVFNSPNGANDFYDKEAIATDPNDANNAVVSLTNFQILCGLPQNGFGQIEVWRTQDGGDTWSGPVIAGPEQPDPVANRGNSGTLQQSSVPVFGPNGEVLVTWQVGPTFSASGVASTKAAIFVARSLDGGATWSAPRPVAGPVPSTGVKRFWPVVTVSPEGSVNVVYYESQEKSAPDGSNCDIAIGGGLHRIGSAHSFVDTKIVRSDDGGGSFGTPVRVSSATSDWCAGTVNIRPNFGDYIGAVTVGGTTFAVWADSRKTISINGVPRNVVDVFFASVG